MATTDYTEFAGADSSGYRATRIMKLYGETSMTATAGLPQIGDAHPEDASYVCESIGKPVVNEVGAKFFIYEVSYRKPIGSGSGFTSDGKEKAPWELGVQNFQSTHEQNLTKTLTKLYSTKEKKFIPYVNTAGSRLIRAKNELVRVISFDYNLQLKSGKLNPKAAKEIINATDIKVCGISIPAYCGKLMPMSSSVHTVYKADGKTIKWEYETIHVTIKINNDTWIIEDLNVGRFAKFPFRNSSGKEELILGPIFQYTPWVTNNAATNAKVKPKFGSISDVMAAQANYAKVNPTGKIPYSQCDEDLPLDKDGKLYQAAIDDPVNNPYLVISGYETEPSSWEGMGLRREM